MNKKLFLNKLMPLAITLFILNCYVKLPEELDTEAAKRKQCYANIGCHDAFMYCQIKSESFIRDKGERDIWCIYQVISCREFCARCGGGGRYGPQRTCFTSRYSLVGTGSLTSPYDQH